MNSCRLSFESCPVRVNHSIAAIHSFPLGSNVPDKGVQMADHRAHDLAQPWIWHALHRSRTTSVMFASVTYGMAFS